MEILHLANLIIWNFCLNHYTKEKKGEQKNEKNYFGNTNLHNHIVDGYWWCNHILVQYSAFIDINSAATICATYIQNIGWDRISSIKFADRVFFYSNLKASIGLSFAAFFAGMIQKISPIEIEERTAINTDFTEIMACMVFCTLFTIHMTNMLKSIHIIHQMAVISTDSAKNWLIMSFFFAQIAFLIQISFVLSVTETSMIFMTPIHPTSSEYVFL